MALFPLKGLLSVSEGRDLTLLEDEMNTKKFSNYYNKFDG